MPKHDYTQRLARIIKILTLLYHPKSSGILCAKALAQEFGVSLRTLRRDVAMMGAEFHYEKDTIHFLGSRLPTPSQAHSFIALTLLKSFAHSMSGNLKAQMLSLLDSLESTSAPTSTELFFTRSNLEEITLPAESIALLQNAIKTRKVISFDFLKEPNALSEAPYIPASTPREVLPLKILNFSGEWYLLGLESSVMKKFYLNSIANVCELRQGEKVSDELLGRLDNALNAWFVPEKKPFMVHLWIDPKVAKYFKRKKISPNQHLVEKADGSLEITLHITSIMEIAPLVLMWIPNIIALEPKELREFIINSTDTYLKRISE